MQKLQIIYSGLAQVSRPTTSEHPAQHLRALAPDLLGCLAREHPYQLHEGRGLSHGRQVSLAIDLNLGTFCAQLWNAVLAAELLVWPVTIWTTSITDP